jgi:hypothetical protein
VKIGDLVKLNSSATEGIELNPRPPNDYERVGIVTEWEKQESPLASGWVRWGGNVDWDIEYEEDLEIISESG